MKGLVRGQRGEAMLVRCFGDRLIEELPRQLIVASTDMYARAPNYHRRGLVRDAVAASMCLPVLFSPRLVDGRVLIDGSLTDNCPVGPFSQSDEGPVVAIGIGAGSARPRAATGVPSLGETVMRVTLMGTRRTAGGETQATVWVTPDTRGVGLLEFHQIDQAREAGRRAGEAARGALRETVWR